MSSRQVQIAEETMQDGTPAAVITTATARYVYDTVGGGFSALLDRQGKDWISYSLDRGPAGEFRGIPNMVFRKRSPNNHFHPGHRNERACTTVVSRNASGSVRIESSVSNRWRIRWDIADNAARFATERVDPDDSRHWFLYEGTPGGRLRLRDRSIRSDGFDAPLSDGWEASTNSVQWVAFASRRKRRSLLFKWESSTTVPVSYYPMKSMTVFGFGRRLRSTESHLTTSCSVVMAFIESISFDDLSEAARDITV